MNLKTTNHNFRPASLRAPGTARTVLLRMAADQERADRIRALKLERPDLTWRRIADHVGVTERAASDWQKKGGIEYDNAKKLAALLEVDVDYIWRGPTAEERAPSPFAGQDALADRLDAIEQAITEARTEREEQARRYDELIEKQNGLLARQSAILERIEQAQAGGDAAAGRLEDATQRADETAHTLDAAVKRAGSILRGGTQSRKPAAKRPAPKRNPKASSEEPE